MKAMTQVAFERCPVCGGELVEKEVEKLLRGGAHVAVLKVCASVTWRAPFTYWVGWGTC